MPQYLTPGVYLEKIDEYQAGIAKTRTDIAGFVGIAEKGPLNSPVRIESWKQFQATFGTYIPQGYLAYAVNGFFANEGKVCYVVRIADINTAGKAEKAAITLLDKNGIPTLEITALSEGQWGGKIKVLLSESSLGTTSSGGPTLQPGDGSYSIVKSAIGFETGSLVKVFQNNAGTVIEKYHYAASVDIGQRKIIWEVALEHTPTDFDFSQPIYFSTLEFTLTFTLNNSIKEIFTNLSLRLDHSRYVSSIINGNSQLVTVKNLGSGTSVPKHLPDPVKLTKGFVYLEGGKDGTGSITIDDIIGDLSADEKRGLRCFEDVDEVAMIVIPDIMIRPGDTGEYRTLKTEPCLPDIEEFSSGASLVKLAPIFSDEDIERAQQAMIDHCERLKDRVAILDSPVGLDIAEVLEWRDKFASAYAALYFPWIVVKDPLRLDGNITCPLPPSGHIAGVYARTDLLKGVHKAPANEEISGAEDIVLAIDDAQQELLNPENVNCIRSFPGRGIMIWGARTLSREALWRYINIRRLMIMIEESVEESMQWAVFEPNDARLRNGIKLAASTFLQELWRKGALSGETAEQAFYVKCDEDNNPQEVIDNGRVITEIGAAPSVPGEFVVFRIGRVKDGFQIMEEEEM